MKVYLDENGDRRLIGRAEVPADCGPVFEVPMFGAAAPAVVESFTVGTVTHLPDGGGAGGSAQWASVHNTARPERRTTRTAPRLAPAGAAAPARRSRNLY